MKVNHAKHKARIAKLESLLSEALSDYATEIASKALADLSKANPGKRFCFLDGMGTLAFYVHLGDRWTPLGYDIRVKRDSIIQKAMERIADLDCVRPSASVGELELES